MLRNLLLRALPLEVRQTAARGENRLVCRTSFNGWRQGARQALAKLISGFAAALLAALAISAATATTFAAPGDAPQSSTPGDRWTSYGYNIVAPQSVWPMLELLHTQHFDWELASASARPTPILWATLPTGVYGSYQSSQNVVRLSYVLQNEKPALGAAFLAHELTHLTDDLNGKLGDIRGDACFAAETRAFVNEANFWLMVNGPKGTQTTDPIEDQENAKMFAFVGNTHYVDVVIRTTPSYIQQCGK